MHGSTILATFLGASAVFAAPAWPQVKSGLANTIGHEAVSDYFNLLAQKIDVAKLSSFAPSCDVSKAQMPTLSADPLSSPAAGLVIKHVAIGRGTQNYTCDASNATAAPVLAGAVATLFNASCVASTYPDLLHMLPRLALQFDLPYSTSVDERMGPTNLLVSGKHFFTNATTPFFNLDTPRYRIGEAPCSKIESRPAPADAPKGRNGEAAVGWLRLAANPDATGGLHEVFRVGTAGGSPPATCQGMPASFEVQYAAEYWFFASL
ncbi:putative malate dehydrogenase [Rosellinia necatrix]|uniref:Putative malate dehydrogenase n=1 Tax=Rosellinia necatrix TaxID=77044 RepID=A0A1W2THG7_ROSNE|nr:putative malate dehydrogenase [Rosellinia necatrix]